MRTIRALAAAAALAGVLAASGPAAAKIMQLTLAGVTNGFFHDTTGILGAGAGNLNDQPTIDFVFTYDTGATNSHPTLASLLSARLEVRYPDFQATPFTPDGDILGSFNIPLDQFAYINMYAFLDPSNGYYQLNDDFISGLTLTHFTIDVPFGGIYTIDQEMTYYPDVFTSANGPTQPRYGNSVYDLIFEKATTNDENAVFIYYIYTITNETGAMSTRYVNFKDITPRGVPEPAAWALMLLGFGGVGAALRRRRAAGVAA